jgi:Plasmid maintenance system antidote protein
MGTIMSAADIDFAPAEVFPPGDFLREELAERGWTQEVFAEIIGKSERLVNEVIAGKREITPPTAQAIAAAIGTSAQFWLNLETTYRLYLVQKRLTGTDDVSRRAKLYSKVPVKEMVKRGWIERSSNVEILEKRICDFLGIRNIDDEPDRMPHAARKSSPYGSVDPTLRAWLCRARQMAAVAQTTAAFTKDSVQRAKELLQPLLRAAAETRQVSRILSSCGIRFVVVETVSKAKVDGVTFWLDRSSPVIAVSLRYDRIDWFWFTLMHELVHAEQRDGRSQPVIDDLDEKILPDSEKQVNACAQEWLVPGPELNDFIARTAPLYSRSKIENFARRIGVHPGIVVGQLHHREALGYSHHRAFLVKVRATVTASTLTDGWGFASSQI